MDKDKALEVNCKWDKTILMKSRPSPSGPAIMAWRGIYAFNSWRINIAIKRGIAITPAMLKYCCSRTGVWQAIIASLRSLLVAASAPSLRSPPAQVQTKAIEDRTECLTFKPLTDGLTYRALWWTFSVTSSDAKQSAGNHRHIFSRQWPANINHHLQRRPKYSSSAKTGERYKWRRHISAEI